MTHPKEAIEAVARVLHDAAYDGNWDHKHMDPTFRAIFTAEATAILDRISPMLVAAEREACAARAIKYIEGLDYIENLSQYDLSAAIRAQSEGGER